MISVSSLTTPSCLSRSRTPPAARTCHRLQLLLRSDVCDRVRRKVMHESGRVVPEQRQVWHLLPPHHCGGEVLRERVIISERPVRRVHVDHRHCWMAPLVVVF